MDPIELSYDSQEAIPEAVAPLYTEKDGKFVLTGVKGMKTPDDVNNVMTGLTKERAEHAETKNKLKPLQEWLGDRSIEDIQTALDEVEELRLKAESAGGEIPKEKLEEMVLARVQREVAPKDRKLQAAETELGELRSKLEEVQGELVRRDLHSHLREIGAKAKLRPEAMEDWLFLGERIFERQEDGTFASKDGVGVTPNVTADIVLGDLKATRGHWWPDSVGGGATGSGGGTGGITGNPWSKAHWNKTEQGRYIRQHGEEKAKAAAKAAGVDVHAIRPAETSKAG